MAEDFAIGKALVIPQSVLNNINKLDEKINLIASDSEKMATHFSSAMTRMGGNASELLAKLQNINNVINNIGSINAKGIDNVSSGLGKTNTEAEKVANSVTEAAVALNRFSKTWQELGGRPQVAKSFEILTNKEQLNLLKEARNEADAYSRSLSEANKKNQAETKASTNAIKEQMQAEKNRHDENIARLKQEGSSIKIMSSSYRDYVSAITMSEQTETSRTKKIERMNTVLEELRKKESEYSVEIDVLTRKINSLTKENERLAASRQNSQKALEAQAKLESKLRRSNYQSYVTSTEGSLRTADKANTYAQRAQAIKNLEAAIKKLRTTDANYQKDLQRLSDAHKRLSAEQKKVEANFRSIKGTQSNLMNTSDQLARKLALIFSVSQIEGYVNKLVRVRGEFELQNTALASILQNKDKADKLFGQITDLAVQSPFTLKELVTYTKSLSAYSVEYEKLYDTTKMLADVSAGLGVDMQRLILAFGQVKAANFLRGTETRQFTEAGINMLGELAKYYSELEGRIVSVNEVQDRQFKRMISFQDVEQVFKRLTSAGGMFYNMQERQAETIAGMMSNLQDRIDLMLNSIGKSNEGTIKGVIELLQSLLANYELVINMLKTAGAAFLLYKANVLAAKESLILFAIDQGVITKEIPKSLSMLQLLNVGFKKLSISIKTAGNALKTFALSNIPVLAFAAIATAIYEVIHWNDEYNEQISSINKKNIENAANLNKIVEAYEKIAKSARKAVDSQKDFSYSDETYKELYAQLSKLSESLKDRGYTMPIQLEFVTPQNIDEAFKGGKDILQLANDFSVEFGKAMASQTTATEGWFNVFGDNLSTDLQELSDAYGNVAGGFKANLDLIENEVITISDKLTGAAKGYYEELRAGQKDEESSTEWTLRRLDLLYKINQEVGVNLQEGRYKSMITNERTLIQLYRQRLDISNKEKEVQYELGKVVDELIKKYGSIENLKKVINKNPIVIKTEIDRYFEKEELDAQTKRFASHWLANKLQIPVEFTIPKALPTFFNDFRDTVKTLDTKGIFTKALEGITDLTGLEDLLQKKYKDLEKDEEVLNRANTKRLDLTKQIAAEREKILSSNKDERDAAQITLNNLEKQKSVIDKMIISTKKRISEEKGIVKNIAESFNLTYKTQKQSGTDNTSQIFKDRLSFFERANKEYEKLLQNYSKEEARAKGISSMMDEAQQRGVGGIFMSAQFDEKGTLDSLNKVKAMYKSLPQEMQIEFAKAFGGIQLDMDIEVRQDRVKAIQDQFSNLFGNYELSLELDKLGLDKDLMSQLFGVEVFDLSQLRKVLEPFKNELQNVLGKEGVSAWDEMNKKISEAEENELQDRLKTYSQYLKKSVSERVAIEMEAQKKIAEVRATEEFTPEQQERIVTQIRQETQVKKDEQAWKEFQDSELYIKMFEDLEFASTKALDAMEQKLIEVRSSLKTLSPTELKQINDQLEKIREAKISRNPFEGLNDNIKGYIEYLKKAKDLNDKFIESQTKQDDLSKLYDNQLMVRNEIEAQYAASVKVNGEGSKESLLLKEKLTQQDKILDVTLKQLVAQGKITQEYADQIRKGETLGSNAQKQINNIGSIGSQVVSSISEVTGMLSNWGIEFGDVFEGVLSGIGQMFDGLNKIDITRPMSIISGAVSVVSGIGNTFASIFGFGNKDKKKEEEIERQIEQVEKLQKAYEKLEEAIDSAYSIDTLERSTDQAIANLEKQNQALQNSIAAEQDKKKTDDDRIKEWQEAIESNNEAIEELVKEQISTVTAGILDDGLSAADAFVDAWLEAFQETGDGLSGLEDNFNEMLLNMIKRQAAMSIMSPLIDNMREELEKYINKDDTELTINEAEKFAGYIKNILPQYSEAMENYLNAMKSAGIDFGGGGDTMTGLSKSISSITEDTAEVLASITESIRYFTSDSNTVLHNIYNLMINPPVENPFLSELKVQSSYLSNISSLLGSVIKSSSGKGKILRVEMA